MNKEGREGWGSMVRRDMAGQQAIEQQRKKGASNEKKTGKQSRK